MNRTSKKCEDKDDEDGDDAVKHKDVDGRMDMATADFSFLPILLILLALLKQLGVLRVRIELEVHGVFVETHAELLQNRNSMKEDSD